MAQWTTERFRWGEERQHARVGACRVSVAPGHMFEGKLSRSKFGYAVTCPGHKKAVRGSARTLTNAKTNAKKAALAVARRMASA